MVKGNMLLILLLLFMAGIAFAQESESPGMAVYIELMGKGFISGNVDLSIGQKSRLTLGITMLDHEFAKDAENEEYPTLTLPTPGVMYLHLFGRERNFFEAGFGFSISPVPWREYCENDSALSLHACLGYRFQVSNHFFFRAGLTPFYRINWAFLPLAGLSLGYSW